MSKTKNKDTKRVIVGVLSLFFVLGVSRGVLANDHLKYFGYWGDGMATDGTYKDYTNVVWLSSNQYNTGICGISPGNDVTCQIKDAVAHGQKVILSLHSSLLFGDSPASYANLCDPTIFPSCIKDYIGNWNDYKQYIKPYVDDGSIIALFIIDEPVFYYGDRDLVRRGIYDTMYEKLDLVTKLIKQDFPNLPLATTLLPSDIMKLTYPNIPPILQAPNGQSIPSFQEPLPIPSGFDWLSFDCYSDWDNCYQTGVSITQLHNALKAKLRPGQKMFLVPDGFLYVDENYKAGDTPSPAEVASWLTRVNYYYELAKNDSDVIAMFPFKWGDTSYDGVGHLYVNGVPQIETRYEQIGQEIVFPTPTVTFTATPSSVTSGQSANLAWSSTNATSCTSSGDGASWGWPSGRYTSGAQDTPALTSTQTYTMFCTGPGGVTQISSVTVSVRPSPTSTPTPTVSPTPTPSITPTPTPTPTSSQRLIRFSNDAKVYELRDNKLTWIPSLEVFNTLNLSWAKVEVLSIQEKASYTRAKLLRAPNDPKVYYITESGLKRWIPTEQVFLSYGNRWEDIVTVQTFELTAIPDNTLIRVPNDAKVYQIQGLTKHWIATADAFNRNHFDWTKIAPVNQTESDFYVTGDTIN